MINVTYKCDRCGEGQESRVESGGFPPLWEISILCEPIDSHVRYHPLKRQSAQWCNSCVEKMQVIRPLIAADAPTPAPTIEDIIRDLVKQEQSE